jgi:hypothetical protein
MSTSLTSSQDRSHAKRPLIVTSLAVAVLTISVLNLIRFFEAIRLWEFLSDLPGISPVYLAASGLIWALLGLPLSWGLWRGNARAPAATRILCVAYCSYEWVERFIMARMGSRLANWPFFLVFTLIILGVIFWGLSREKVKAFFGERHEPSFKNSKTTRD